MTNDERIAWLKRITAELALLPPEEQAAVLETMRDYLERQRESWLKRPP